MRREFTGKHMAAVMVGFFAVIIAVNLVLATFANRTWSGLVVRNSYVASQDFNSRIAASTAQEAKGWRADFSVTGGAAHFRLTDAAGKPVPLHAVSATFARPTHENEDRRFPLRADGAGGFISTESPGAGLWTVTVESELADGGVDTRLFRLHLESATR